MKIKITSLLAMTACLSLCFGYTYTPSAQPTEPAAVSSYTAGDYTNLQYNADGPFGIDVDGWNTCDADGHPTPAVDTSDIVVAVVDSGVDYTHPDLKNVMWDKGLDYPELTAMGGGRYGINVNPCDSYGRPYDSTDPMDDYHHGTHVAGIIAAEWNGIGVSGRTAVDADGKKIADTYVGAYGDTHFAPADGIVSMSPVFSACCTAYRDRYYVLGVTVSEEGDYVFAVTDVKTKVQYGDVVRSTDSSS